MEDKGKRKCYPWTPSLAPSPLPLLNSSLRAIVSISLLPLLSPMLSHMADATNCYKHPSPVGTLQCEEKDNLVFALQREEAGCAKKCRWEQAPPPRNICPLTFVIHPCRQHFPTLSIQPCSFKSVVNICARFNLPNILNLPCVFGTNFQLFSP